MTFWKHDFRMYMHDCKVHLTKKKKNLYSSILLNYPLPISYACMHS